MKKRCLKVVLIVLVLFILLLIYYFLFINYEFGIPCLFHKITGLYCPGCGITRMIFSLINLDIKQAFRYNSLAFILLPFILVYIIYYIYLYIYDKKDNVVNRIPNYIWVILIVITVLFGIFRNIID